jgi:hypothetical protein
MILNIQIIYEDIFEKIIIKDTDLNLVKNKIYEKFLIPLDNQDWFFENNRIDSNFKLKDGNYIVSNFNNYISLLVNYNNKIINLPHISKKILVNDLKNILSTKENIYFNDIPLNNNKKLLDYKITSNDILKIYSN